MTRRLAMWVVASVQIFVDGRNLGECTCTGPDDSFTCRCRVEIGIDRDPATPVGIRAP